MYFSLYAIFPSFRWYFYSFSHCFFLTICPYLSTLSTSFLHLIVLSSLLSFIISCFVHSLTSSLFSLHSFVDFFIILPLFYSFIFPYSLPPCSPSFLPQPSSLLPFLLFLPHTSPGAPVTRKVTGKSDKSSYSLLHIAHTCYIFAKSTLLALSCMYAWGEEALAINCSNNISVLDS